ncbi:MAG: exodeoxyribonuclease III [Verrucomicrobiota bacterium]
MTWNVNGIRAAWRKGFIDHVEHLAPDVLLLQEVRALPEQMPDDCREAKGWHVHWHPAEKKGYAGTAIWSRQPLEAIEVGIGARDPEGRVLKATIAGVNVVSVYLPYGSSSDEAQARKDKWMKKFKPWARKLAKADEPWVMGGDFNIAHTEQDIFNVSGNKKSSGFLPHEREWFGRLLKDGWHDLFREHVGDIKGPYSWWSNRGRARELDRGWRIDYLLANPPLQARFRSAEIHRKGGLEVSDHAPVIIDLD